MKVMILMILMMMMKLFLIFNELDMFIYDI